MLQVLCSPWLRFFPSLFALASLIQRPPCSADPKCHPWVPVLSIQLSSDHSFVPCWIITHTEAETGASVQVVKGQRTLSSLSGREESRKSQRKETDVHNSYRGSLAPAESHRKQTLHQGSRSIWRQEDSRLLPLQ